jgi:hypothetical protein
MTRPLVLGGRYGLSSGYWTVSLGLNICRKTAQTVLITLNI